MSRRGQMWKYFSVVDVNTKKAECNYCKKILSFKTTVSNLKNHLKQKHFIIYEAICGDSIKNDNETGNEFEFEVIEVEQEILLSQTTASGGSSIDTPLDNKKQQLQESAPRLTVSDSRTTNSQQERTKRNKNFNPRRSVPEQPSRARADFLAVAASNAESMRMLASATQVQAEATKMQAEAAKVQADASLLFAQAADKIADAFILFARNYK